MASATAALAAERIVYTVNYPLAYFAERIGGGIVDVRYPVPADIDPAFWKPAPEAIAAYQTADLILLNGAGYAGWTGQASLPRRKLVDTSRSFRDAYLPGEKTPVHQHGPGGEHTHGQIAFTTWLDPEQAIAQARAIESAFARVWPEDAPGFAARTTSLVADLEALDCELETAFREFSGESLLASHPVYSYLARRYGLELRSLTWEPDLDPDDSGWQAFDGLLAEKSARWMLWEAAPAESIAGKLEARGIEPIVFEVLGNRPARGDYLSVMRANVETLRRARGVAETSVPGCVRVDLTPDAAPTRE
jgi:zinc transport system substrate-binding protein